MRPTLRGQSLSESMQYCQLLLAKIRRNCNYHNHVRKEILKFADVKIKADKFVNEPMGKWNPLFVLMLISVLIVLLPPMLPQLQGLN